MTIKVSCGMCGKNYKAPDKAAGKRLRCKECGESIKIPEPEVEYGDDDDGFSNLLADAVELESKSKTIRRPIRKPMVKAEKYQGDEDGPVTRKKENNYTKDLMETFLFPLDPANMFTFVMIWVLLCMRDLILPYGGRLGFMGYIIILGWYSNYRFSVIYEATSGRKELPELAPEEGYVIPMLKWAGTWLLVHLPAFLYMGVVIYLLFSNLGDEAVPFLTPEEIVEAMPFFHLGVFVFLYCLGLFFWPILALCVAVGGFETVFRIDLMLLTIWRSKVAYFFTAGGMFLTSVVYTFTAIVALQLGFFGIIIMMAIVLYMEIVALRMIGLYYHHFKKRFAWHWG